MLMGILISLVQLYKNRVTSALVGGYCSTQQSACTFTYSLQVAVASSILNIFRSKAVNILGKRWRFIQWYFEEDTMKDGMDFRSGTPKVKIILVINIST